jgi:putative Ca2+/H+ antiporter (TMEM165/GDT1 family)
MCRKTVYSSTGNGSDMSDDHLTLREVLVSIGLSILLFFVFSGSFGDWLDDYLSDEFSPLAVVLFVVFLGVILYLEYQKKQTAEKEGDGHYWFSKETHELWNSKNTKGKIVYVLGYIIATIIAVVFAFAIMFFLLAWFYSQVP